MSLWLLTCFCCPAPRWETYWDGTMTRIWHNKSKGSWHLFLHLGLWSGHTTANSKIHSFIGRGRNINATLKWYCLYQLVLIFRLKDSNTLGFGTTTLLRRHMSTIYCLTGAEDDSEDLLVTENIHSEIGASKEDTWLETFLHPLIPQSSHYVTASTCHGSHFVVMTSTLP